MPLSIKRLNMIWLTLRSHHWGGLHVFLSDALTLKTISRSKLSLRCTEISTVSQGLIETFRTMHEVLTIIFAISTLLVARVVWTSVLHQHLLPISVLSADTRVMSRSAARSLDSAQNLL